MLCSFEWHFRKRSFPIDRIARRLASVWDAILKVRMSAKASNDRIHWPRTRKRRATRKHGSVKWGKLAPITDRKRQRNSSSGAESLDSKGVTRLAALAISTRWFFSLTFSISFLVLFSPTFLFVLIRFAWKGADPLVGWQKWWEKRHSGSTLVGLGPSPAIN